MRRASTVKSRRSSADIQPGDSGSSWTRCRAARQGPLAFTPPRGASRLSPSISLSISPVHTARATLARGARSARTHAVAQERGEGRARTDGGRPSEENRERPRKLRKAAKSLLPPSLQCLIPLRLTPLPNPRARHSHVPSRSFSNTQRQLGTGPGAAASAAAAASADPARGGSASRGHPKRTRMVGAGRPRMGGQNRGKLTRKDRRE